MNIEQFYIGLAVMISPQNVEAVEWCAENVLDKINN